MTRRSGMRIGLLGAVVLLLAGCQAPRTASSSVDKTGGRTAPSLRVCRGVYLWYDWTVDDAEIDAIVPALMGHVDRVCIMAVGDKTRVERIVKHVRGRPHPPVIFGLATAEMMPALDADLAYWSAYAQLAAYCAVNGECNTIVLDLEWHAGPYIRGEADIDFAAFEAGLTIFQNANRLRDTALYLPHWEGDSGPAVMNQVLRRTRLIESVRRCIPRLRIISAAMSTWGSYELGQHRDEFGRLNECWSYNGLPIEQMFTIQPDWWPCEELRALVAAKPRSEFWFYVEPPYSNETAARLLECVGR